MPGSSLWLIPPPTSDFNKHLQDLITASIPRHFSNTKTHDFIPHVTITSNISPSLHTPNPQAWLDSLDLPLTSAITITAEIEALDPEDPFFKKLTLRLGKDGSLCDLAARCRAEGVLGGDEERAREWVRNEYAPHLSLM